MPLRAAQSAAARAARRVTLARASADSTADAWSPDTCDDARAILPPIRPDSSWRSDARGVWKPTSVPSDRTIRHSSSTSSSVVLTVRSYPRSTPASASWAATDSRVWSPTPIASQGLRAPRGEHVRHRGARTAPALAPRRASAQPQPAMPACTTAVRTASGATSSTEAKPTEPSAVNAWTPTPATRVVRCRSTPPSTTTSRRSISVLDAHDDVEAAVSRQRSAPPRRRRRTDRRAPCSAQRASAASATAGGRSSPARPRTTSVARSSSGVCGHVHDRQPCASPHADLGQSGRRVHHQRRSDDQHEVGLPHQRPRLG